MLSSIRWQKCKKFTQKSYRPKGFTHSYESQPLNFSVTFLLMSFLAWVFLQLFQQIRNQRQILHFLMLKLKRRKFFMDHTSSFRKFYLQIRTKKSLALNWVTGVKTTLKTAGKIIEMEFWCENYAKNSWENHGDGILERKFSLRFLGINSSLLRLVFYRHFSVLQNVIHE